MKNTDKKAMMGRRGSMGGMFFVTYIGAAVYFVQHSQGFWGVILALLKAIVWPAFFIHRVFELLHV